MKINEEMFQQDSFQHYLGRLVFYISFFFGVFQVFLSSKFLLQESLNFFTGLGLNFGPLSNHEIDIYFISLILVLNISTIPFVIIRNRDGQPKRGKSVFWKSDLSLKRFFSKMFFFSFIFYSVFLILYSLIPGYYIHIFGEIDHKIPSNILTIPFIYLLVSWIVVSKTKVSYSHGNE
jgi:hypothetical protein